MISFGLSPAWANEAATDLRYSAGVGVGVGAEKSQVGLEAETISSVQMKVLIDWANEWRALLTLYNFWTIQHKSLEKAIVFKPDDSNLCNT